MSISLLESTQVASPASLTTLRKGSHTLFISFRSITRFLLFHSMYPLGCHVYAYFISYRLPSPLKCEPYNGKGIFCLVRHFAQDRGKCSVKVCWVNVEHSHTEFHVLQNACRGDAILLKTINMHRNKQID